VIPVTTLNGYQALAAQWAKPTDDRREELAKDALGVAGEAGEVADLLKKHLFHGIDLDVSKLRSELGDVLWYVAALARHAGLSLEDVATSNLDKLQARYPDGFKLGGGVR
jgi:NTP pyrophosphatase (non-canonical NTP hydrolase)